MTDVVTNPDRPKPKRTNKTADGPVLMSGVKLAAHFRVVRQQIDQLAQGRDRAKGRGLFDQDASRLKYLMHLRAEHKRSARAQADADHVRAKTVMLQLRLMEKKGELVPWTEVDALIDGITGIVLTHLSGMGARCFNDLVVRRKIDGVSAKLSPCKEPRPCSKPATVACAIRPGI
jgi:hypothetical protein